MMKRNYLLTLDRIAHPKRQTDRRRPLCPYPQVAKYKGGGSTDDTVKFTRQKP